MTIPEAQRHTKKLQIRANPEDCERFREIAKEHNETLGDALKRLLENYEDE